MELREGDSANGSEIQFQRIEGESDGEQEDVQKKGGGGGERAAEPRRTDGE